MEAKQNDIGARLKALTERLSGEGTAADICYAVLRQAIIEGDLPPGRRLFADDLAEAMGFSRTPVREALRKLEAQEFVEAQVRNGLIVRDLSEDQLLEIYAIREALEGMAARMAAENMSEIDLAEIRHTVADMDAAANDADVARFRALTLTFHRILARASRNRRLFKMIQEQHELVLRWGPSTLQRPGRLAEALAAHKDLLSALERRDRDAAEAITRDYRRGTFNLRLAAHRAGGGRSVDAGGRR